MQLTWAVYIIAVSLLVGVGALWADRICRHFGRSTRWVWVASLVVSAGLPLVPLLFPEAFRGLIAEWLYQWGGQGGPVYDVFALLRDAQWMVSLDLPDPRTLALVSWGTALVVTSLWLLYSFRDLRRRREQWKEGVVDGRDCLLSRETGPAIVGVLRHRLVLPEWMLDLPSDRREMVLAHEEEHLRERDPWLLGVAYATLLVFPWNPVLWWQVRRLRLAVELDCDRRVTEAGRDRATYSELLLDIARSGEPAPTTAFARGESHTGERIREIMDPTRLGTGGSPSAPSAPSWSDFCWSCRSPSCPTGARPPRSTGARWARPPSPGLRNA